MLQFNETNSRRNTFLPPIKNSKNKLVLSNKDPILYENNLKKDRELLEIGIDKFSVLTNQPNTIEKIKFESFVPKSFSSLENLLNNHTTSSNFEWNSKEMPKLKINKSSDLSLNAIENQSAKKKRLLFEQKLILEQKQFEQNYRNVRAAEFLNRSNETYKRIHKEKSKESTNYSNSKKDIWASSDFRDINLQNDIIKTFYSIDNRAIRYNQQFRNDFFAFTPNATYNELKEQSSANFNV